MALPIPVKRSMHVFHGSIFTVLPEWRDRLASIGLDEQQDWSQLSSKETVSSSYHTTSNFRFELDDGSIVFFKRYVYRRIRIKHWLQPSKAAVEASGFNELSSLQIPTLETLAYGERRKFGLLQAAFIVTRGISNVVQLDQFLIHHWLKLPQRSKIELLKQLQAILVQQLNQAHGAGFYHWDLKLRNILLQQKTNDELRLIWIDCPRSRRLAANDYRGAVTDLSAMARVGFRVLTPGQQMRFLLDYSGNNRALARKLYRSIANELSKRPPRPLWHFLPKDDPEFIRNNKL